MSKVKIEYTQFAKILKADVVNVYHLKQFFKKEDIDFDEFGNIFIGFNDKTKGLPILVAHTDNVLGPEKEPVFDLNRRCIKGIKNGIGFDDKAGIMAIISLWHHFKDQKFRIIFPADEETGGEGSKMISPEIYSDAKWILELDRKSNKDFIQVSGGERLCSDEFAEKFLDMGYELADGLFTDVNIFKPLAEHVNMANISIGYYNPHTDNEFLDTVAFENTVDRVAEFIEQDYTFEDDVPDDKTTNQYDYTTCFHNNKMCEYCGGDCTGTVIYNRYGERFCCKECMDAFEKEYINEYGL